jgi:hypothetical protein
MNFWPVSDLDPNPDSDPNLKRTSGRDRDPKHCFGSATLVVPLTLALLNLPKGKSLGRSKPATNS